MKKAKSLFYVLLILAAAAYFIGTAQAKQAAAATVEVYNEAVTVVETTEEAEVEIVEPIEAEVSVEEEEVIEIAPISVDFDMFSDCPDVKGWFYLETASETFSFPLVQGTDNDYYMHHDVYGNDDKNGCIMLDYHANMDDDYKIIFGHTITRTQSMLYWIKDCQADDTLWLISSDGTAHSYTCFANVETTKQIEVMTNGAFNVQNTQCFLDHVCDLSGQEYVDAEGLEIVTVATCDRPFAGADGRRLVVFVRAK